jgi:hypothetical protein
LAFFPVWRRLAKTTGCQDSFLQADLGGKELNKAIVVSQLEVKDYCYTLEVPYTVLLCIY